MLIADLLSHGAENGVTLRHLENLTGGRFGGRSRRSGGGASPFWQTAKAATFCRTVRAKRPAASALCAAGQRKS